MLSTLDLIGHLGFALAALGLLMRNMFWLRVCTLGSGVFGLYYNAQTPGGPMWPPIIWTCIFMAINLIALAALLRERRPIPLTAYEEDLRQAVFSGLSPAEYRKLIHLAEWRTVQPGDLIARLGDPADRITVVAHGAAVACAGVGRSQPLRDGAFIGALAFADARPFTASIAAVEATLLAQWDIAPLRSLFLRNPLLALGFQRAALADAHRVVAGPHIGP